MKRNIQKKGKEMDIKNETLKNTSIIDIYNKKNSFKLMIFLIFISPCFYFVAFIIQYKCDNNMNKAICPKNSKSPFQNPYAVL